MLRGVRENYKHIYFYSIIFFALFISFQFNCFGTAKDSWFLGFQRESEALVVGRIIPRTDAGFFHDGGFLGAVTGRGEDYVHETYSHYLGDRGPLESSLSYPYMGHVGLQGYAFSLVDRILRWLGLNGQQRLFALQAITSAALSITFAYFLFLVSRDLGVIPMATSFMFILFSPWLTLFARNLYWVPFTWFLPIVFSWKYYVSSHEDSTAFRYRNLMLGLFLVKCLCGFEYVTAIAGGVVSIAAYSMLRNGKTLMTTVYHVSSLVGALFACVFLAVVTQIVLMALTLGSFTAAFESFIDRVAYRTHGASESFPALADSLNSSVLDVILIYFNNDVVVSIFDILSFTAAEVAVFFVCFLIVIFFYSLFVRHSHLSLLIDKYLFIILTFASSISWFVIAKGHSFIHVQMNFVLWNIPFLLIAPSIVASAASCVFFRSRRGEPAT